MLSYQIRKSAYHRSRRPSPRPTATWSTCWRDGERHCGIGDDRLETPEYPSRWQTRYCIDSMLEHAVMHPIRHAFQLEELMHQRLSVEGQAAGGVAGVEVREIRARVLPARSGQKLESRFTTRMTLAVRILSRIRRPMPTRHWCWRARWLAFPAE